MFQRDYYWVQALDTTFRTQHGEIIPRHRTYRKESIQDFTLSILIFLCMYTVLFQFLLFKYRYENILVHMMVLLNLTPWRTLQFRCFPFLTFLFSMPIVEIHSKCFAFECLFYLHLFPTIFSSMYLIFYTTYVALSKVISNCVQHSLLWELKNVKFVVWCWQCWRLSPKTTPESLHETCFVLL